MRALLPLLLTTAACTVGTGTPLPSDFEAYDRLVIEVDVAQKLPVGVLFDPEGWDSLQTSLEALLEGSGIEVEVREGGTVADNPVDRPWQLHDLRAVSYASLDTEPEDRMSLVHLMVLPGARSTSMWEPEHQVAQWVPELGVVGVWPAPQLYREWPLYEPREPTVVQVTHALGHALGLVDHEIPAITDHLGEDGVHCGDEACVMAAQGDPHDDWALGYVGGWVSLPGRHPDGVLFGPDCLADARAHLAQ